MRTLATAYVLWGLGVFLIAVNYLAAVIWLPHVTAWETSKGRLFESYSQVGWWFTLFGLVATVAGIVVVVRADAPKE